MIQGQLWERKNLQLQGHLERYLRKCRSAGESCHTIAQKLSAQEPACSYATVWRWCQALGIDKKSVASPFGDES